MCKELKMLLSFVAPKHTAQLCASTVALLRTQRYPPALLAADVADRNRAVEKRQRAHHNHQRI